MEPFNLPRGSVRAVLTGGVLVGFVLVAIFGSKEGLAAFSALAGAVLRDYFQTRQDQNRADGPPVGKAAAVGDE